MITEHVNNYKTIFKPLQRALVLGWKWEKKLLIVVSFFTIILGASAYLQYASFSKIVDEIIRLQKSPGSYDVLIRNGILLLVTFLVPTLVREIQQYLLVELRFKFARKITLLSIEEQSKLDIATIESAHFQDLMTKANSRGPLSVYQTLEHGLRNLENVASILAASLFIISLAPVLFFLAFLISIPSFYFYKKYGTQIWWIWDLNPKKRRRYHDRFGMFTHAWTLTELKLFQTKERFRDEVNDLLVSFDQDFESVERKRVKYQLILACIEIVAMAFVIFYLVKMGLAGQLAIGALLLAFNSYRGLFSTCKAFFLVLGYQDETGKYASWWFELFDLKPNIVSSPNAAKPVWNTAPTVVFENVSFKYEGSEVYALKDISFTLHSGEKTALVGLNGAGKTSLIKLLCRIYDPSEGKILINGIDLRTIDLTHWQKALGVLFQDFVDYKLTVAESIALGKGGQPYDMKDIRAAADKATATEFIEEFPKGFDQLLWKGYEDGVLPSKGQRQKIAVARIFYRDALISILDEPTSAIDAPSEDSIFGELESMPNDKSAVLISHRMSAIRNADNIIVLKHGSIAEQGNHTELMSHQGEYYKLFNTQAKRITEEIQ
jgi:ABC-type multidrug transport system fused ATPase/permease subunit